MPTILQHAAVSEGFERAWGEGRGALACRSYNNKRKWSKCQLRFNSQRITEKAAAKCGMVRMRRQLTVFFFKPPNYCGSSCCCCCCSESARSVRQWTRGQTMILWRFEVPDMMTLLLAAVASSDNNKCCKWSCNNGSQQKGKQEMSQTLNQWSALGGVSVCVCAARKCLGSADSKYWFDYGKWNERSAILLRHKAHKSLCLALQRVSNWLRVVSYRSLST